MNQPNRWRPPLTAILAVAVALAGCRSAATDPLDAFSSTATVARGTISVVVQMAGQVVAVSAAELTMGTVGGRIVEITAQAGQEVQQGQALLRLETLELERKVREGEADLQVAEAELLTAQNQYGETELTEAEATLTFAKYQAAAADITLSLAERAGLLWLQEKVDDAEAALQVARDEARLKEIGAGQSSIRSLEYDLAFYQRALRDFTTAGELRQETEKKLGDTERNLAKAQADRQEALRLAEEEVESKEAELARARTRLARALSGEEDPTNAPRLAHKAALSSLEQAQRKVDQLRAGGEGEALQAARIAYEAAQAYVQTARENLNAAALTAPFDGTVLSIYVRPSDRVSPGDRVMFLADLKRLQVQAQVTEIDVPRISVGQPVRISLDVYPGQLFSGKVLLLPFQGVNQGGLSYYQVTTSLEHEKEDIRLGMTANVRVVVGERQDVLTIPVAAVIYSASGETFVKVRSADGKTADQAIQVGLNDGILVEVLSGLTEGQTVVIPLVSPQSPYGPKPIR
jgi:RND family efflux transporter MFP subunit